MTAKHPVPPKEKLESEYLKFGVTISSLAREYGVSNPVLRGWLKLYDIPRKDQRQASIEANNRHNVKVKPPKDELEQFYASHTFGKTCGHYKVAGGTLRQWLTEYGIPLRTLSEACAIAKQEAFAHIQFSKELLEELYDDTKPLSDLADQLGVSTGHIKKLFAKYGIKTNPIYRSQQEIDLYFYMSNLAPDDHWEHSNRSIMAPYEIDMVNHTKKLAVEFCGVYWHAESSSGKGSRYHFDKYKACADKGYKLITVFCRDDENKIKSLIKSLMGQSEKIYARKCRVEEINRSIAKQFHEDHHLSGPAGAKHHLGLFREDELVMVLSMGAARFNNAFEYECTRMTSHSNYSIVGGASKLFSHFIKTYKPKSMITYADLRFGDGSVYPKCGFTYQGITPPNYWYFHRTDYTLRSRVQFQKHKLPTLLEKFDHNKTEFANMVENGWDRIWDCGNAVYHWKA